MAHASEENGAPPDNPSPESRIPPEFLGKWQEIACRDTDSTEYDCSGSWEITATMISTPYCDLCVSSLSPFGLCLVRFANNPIVLHLFFYPGFREDWRWFGMFTAAQSGPSFSCSQPLVRRRVR
jgi:hypothetical protein